MAQVQDNHEAVVIGENENQDDNTQQVNEGQSTQEGEVDVCVWFLTNFSPWRV